MAWVLLQVTIPAGGVVQISTAQTLCRQVVIQNNAAAVMRLGDSTVSSTKGISLAAAGAAGSVFKTEPSVAYAQYLSDFWIQGTAAQVVDCFYNT